MDYNQYMLAMANRMPNGKPKDIFCRLFGINLETEGFVRDFDHSKNPVPTLVGGVRKATVTMFLRKMGEDIERISRESWQNAQKLAQQHMHNAGNQGITPQSGQANQQNNTQPDHGLGRPPESKWSDNIKR